MKALIAIALCLSATPAGASCSKVYTAGGAYLICPGKPTVQTTPDAAPPYPNESCAALLCGTWQHIWEVTTGVGTTPDALAAACGMKQGSCYAYHPDGSLVTAEEAIARIHR